MPIEIWKANVGTWYWTAKSPNGAIIADSGEGYMSRQKAQQGLEATAKEMAKWLAGQQKTKPRKKLTTERQKPAAKRSTSSSSPTPKTGKRGG